MGILQARILEWVAIPSSRGSSQPRDQTQVSRIAGRFFFFFFYYLRHQGMKGKDLCKNHREMNIKGVRRQCLVSGVKPALDSSSPATAQVLCKIIALYIHAAQGHTRILSVNLTGNNSNEMCLFPFFTKL